MKLLLYILGFIWVLPVSILGWIFLGVLAALRQIAAVKVYPDLTVVWDLKNTGFFYEKMSENWFGFSFGNNILVLDVLHTESGIRKLRHENRHSMQQYIFGIFFFPVYIVESLRIFFFHKEKHAYLDNRFEIDARRAAGQRVYIPPELWPQGPGDRWPWFG